MIRIAYYTHDWVCRGTPRSHERVMRNLPRDEFEPYVLYWDTFESDDSLLPALRAHIGNDHLIPFKRSVEKDENDAPCESNIVEVLEKLKPDILHVAKSGATEWPLLGRYARLQIENNIFGGYDASGWLDKSICANHYIEMRRCGCDAVVPHPVTVPMGADHTVREWLKIPSDAVICGRLGRAGCYHPWAFDAFDMVQSEFKNTYFIVVSPCEDALARGSQIENVLFVNPIYTDASLNRFYSSIDIFLHYCNGGETFGISIAEAMIHGVPCISHAVTGDSGHIETIGDGGTVATSFDEYVFALRYLVKNAKARKAVGARARARADAYYNEQRVAAQYASLYRRWLVDA